MKLLHLDPCPVVVDEFAGCSIRFAEFQVRMVGRKPADIERVTGTLIRFASHPARFPDPAPETPAPAA
jgi:hypothetical protein